MRLSGFGARIAQVSVVRDARERACSKLRRTEWQIVELACNAYRKVSVSLYDTLGKDSVGA